MGNKQKNYTENYIVKIVTFVGKVVTLYKDFLACGQKRDELRHLDFSINVPLTLLQMVTKNAPLAKSYKHEMLLVSLCVKYLVSPVTALYLLYYIFSSCTYPLCLSSIRFVCFYFDFVIYGNVILFKTYNV